MGYPDNFNSVLFAQRWGRDRCEARDLTPHELATIGTIERAIGILDVARLALGALPAVVGSDRAPADSIESLDIEITWLRAGADEIRRRPEDEARQTEMETL